MSDTLFDLAVGLARRTYGESPYPEVNRIASTRIASPPCVPDVTTHCVRPNADGIERLGLDPNRCICCGRRIAETLNSDYCSDICAIDAEVA